VTKSDRKVKSGGRYSQVVNRKSNFEEKNCYLYCFVYSGFWFIFRVLFRILVYIQGFVYSGFWFIFRVLAAFTVSLVDVYFKRKLFIENSLQLIVYDLFLTCFLELTRNITVL
jgi:hypothetical protein